MFDPVYLSSSISGLTLSGLALSSEEIKRVRRACGTGSVAEFDDQRGFRIVGTILSKVAEIASPGMTNDDQPVWVFVLKTDLCNACAVAPPGRDAAVMLHGGLIKAIIFHLELSELVYRLNGALETDPMVAVRTTETGRSLSLLAYGAESNLDHYAASGHNLPRLGMGLPDEAKDNMMLAFARALWFIAQHEVGHIRLGHLSRRTGFASPPALAVAENLNTSKSQEFEADNYMADLLEGDQRFAVIDYLLTPLTLLGALERRLSMRSDTHPMALNRMAVMLDRVATIVDAEKFTVAKQMLQLLVDRQQSGFVAHSMNLESAQSAATHLIGLCDQLLNRGSLAAERSSHPWEDIAGHWF
jgi:hypothetical protein